MITKCKLVFILTELLAFNFLFSCSPKPLDNNKTYVISSLAKTDKHFIIPTPPGEFLQNIKYYRQFNFIVDSSGFLYYYYFQPYEFVGDSSISRLLISYLRPGQLIKVPENGTIDFLKCNIINTKIDNIWLSIASEKDTIKSKAFQELYEFLKDSAKNIDFIVRPAREEERFYISCKNKKEYYTSEGKYWDSIKWTHYFKAPIVIDDTTNRKLHITGALHQAGAGKT